MNKKLYRNEYQRVLGGVCSGLADYFEMDVTVVRLLFAFTFFVMGVGLGTYIILWVVLPRRGFMYNQYNNPVVDYTVPPKQPAGQANDTWQTGNPFGGNPFASNAPGSNPFGGNPFGSNPFGSDPAVPRKQKSHAGIIIGVVLIVIGAAILIDNYDLFPDIDFETYWPVILVVIGGGLIISGQKTEMWHKKDWSGTEKPEPIAPEEPSAPIDSAPTDNNPTV